MPGAAHMKTLSFNEAGSVELLASNKNPTQILWSSDDDEDFAELIDNDVLDPDKEDDVGDITDDLIEHNYLDDDEEIEILGPGDEVEDDED